MYARAIVLIAFCWTFHPHATSGKKPTVNVNKYLHDPRTYTAIKKSVTAGTELAIRDCKKIFAHETWNCHVELVKSQVFFRSVLPATKEGAYLQSLGSAGVMYTLTSNCRKDQFKDCGCIQVDKKAKDGQNWRWFGCNENTDFGEAMTVEFVDKLERGTSAKRKALNLHNNNVGRKIVRRAARKLCKCHGISGSCALKVCRRQLVSFKEVAEMVKEKYDNAIHVVFEDNKLKYNSDGPQPLERKNVDMVFYDNSPDYCEPIQDTKYKGMVGRKCSTDADDVDLSTCKRPCERCGMRITKTIKSVQKQCQCKFHWCCRVQCQKCEAKYTETTCVR